MAAFFTFQESPFFAAYRARDVVREWKNLAGLQIFTENYRNNLTD
jgi:hypothetical protein